MCSKKLKILIFLFLVSFCMIFFWGNFYTSDEMLMAMASKSIIENGTLTFHEVYGKTSSRYGIGVSIAAIPFFLIDEIIWKFYPFAADDALFVTLMNAVVTAFIGFVLFLILYKIYLNERIAAGLAIVSILCSDFLPNSRTLLSEPLFSLFLLLSFYFIIDNNEKKKNFILPGIFFAGAILTRFIGILIIPVFFLYIHFETRDKIKTLKKCFIFMIPVFFAYCIIMIINKILRGNFFDNGYGDSAFTAPLLTGLYGILFSVGRGLFIYNPIVILGLIALPEFIKKNKNSGIMILSLSLIWIVVHSKFFMWWAGWTYGSRFVSVIIPFLIIPIGYTLKNWSEKPVFYKMFFSIIIIYSFIFQICQSVVNPMEYNNDLWSFLNSENEYLFIPQMSSLRGMFTLIGDGRITPAVITAYGKDIWPVILVIFLSGSAGTIIFSFLILRILNISLSEKVCGIAEKLRILINENRNVTILFLLFIITIFVSLSLKGRRGLETELTFGNPSQKITYSEKRLRIRLAPDHPDDMKYEMTGYIEMPVPGKYTFFLKVHGNYSIKIGNKINFTNEEIQPQHLGKQNAEFEKGLYPVTVKFKPYNKEDAILYLYCSQPGNAVWHEPINSEYLFDNEQTTFTKVMTIIYRNLWVIFTFLLLPLSLFLLICSEKKIRE